MLTPTTRLKLQAILRRIEAAQPVTLQERIYLQKFASRDGAVASWVRRTERRRLHSADDGLGRLLSDLDLADPDPAAPFHPDHDDIGDWFSGAPHWLRRS